MVTTASSHDGAFGFRQNATTSGRSAGNGKRQRAPKLAVGTLRAWAKGAAVVVVCDVKSECRNRPSVHLSGETGDGTANEGDVIPISPDTIPRDQAYPCFSLRRRPAPQSLVVHSDLYDLAKRTAL